EDPRLNDQPTGTVLKAPDRVCGCHFLLRRNGIKRKGYGKAMVVTPGGEWIFKQTLFRCLPVLAQIRLVREPYAVLQRGARAPAEFRETADVEQLARRAVGLRGVVADAALVTDGSRYHAGEIGNADILAGADVDHLRIRIGLHQMHTGIRHVVDI